MIVLEHINQIFNSISYVIVDIKTSNCWIIDIGDTDEILKLIHNFKLQAILLTHIHYDHIYGLNKLLEKFQDIPVYTNDFGKNALSNPTDNLSIYHNDEFKINDQAVILTVKEGDSISMGNDNVFVIETPGHDKSCVSYIIGNMIFCGDSYIPGEETFTKLQNSDKQLAQYSLNRIKSIARFHHVYAGHKSNFSI